MKLREYQAKNIFSQYGINIPRGNVANNSQNASQVAETLEYPVVLKPQLGVKGRAKVGGIKFADNLPAVENECRLLFNSKIKGESVDKILIEEKISIAEEIYLAVTVDYSRQQPILMASSEGGIDIEELAKKNPEKIIKIPVNILKGPNKNDFNLIAKRIGKVPAQYLKTLYILFREFKAELIEINPLARTPQDEFFAVDAVLNIDEEAVTNSEKLNNLKNEIPITDPLSEEAARSGWTFIELPGDISILSSGAGLTMTILDLIQNEGGKPANFLDTAQIDEEGIYRAFDLLSRAKKTRVLLVNIFAGLNRCDSLASGIHRYLAKYPLEIPMVVRMIGNREEKGHEILKNIGIEPFFQLENAVKEAVKISRLRTTQ